MCGSIDWNLNVQSASGTHESASDSVFGVGTLRSLLLRWLPLDLMRVVLPYVRPFDQVMLYVDMLSVPECEPDGECAVLIAFRCGFSSQSESSTDSVEDESEEVVIADYYSGEVVCSIGGRTLHDLIVIDRSAKPCAELARFIPPDADENTSAAGSDSAATESGVGVGSWIVASVDSVLHVFDLDSGEWLMTIDGNRSKLESIVVSRLCVDPLFPSTHVYGMSASIGMIRFDLLSGERTDFEARLEYSQLLIDPYRVECRALAVRPPPPPPPPPALLSPNSLHSTQPPARRNYDHRSGAVACAMGGAFLGISSIGWVGWSGSRPTGSYWRSNRRDVRVCGLALDQTHTMVDPRTGDVFGDVVSVAPVRNKPSYLLTSVAYISYSYIVFGTSNGGLLCAAHTRALPTHIKTHNQDIPEEDQSRRRLPTARIVHHSAVHPESKSPTPIHRGQVTALCAWPELDLLWTGGSDGWVYAFQPSVLWSTGSGSGSGDAIAPPVWQFCFRTKSDSTSNGECTVRSITLVPTEDQYVHSSGSGSGSGGDHDTRIMWLVVSVRSTKSDGSVQSTLHTFSITPDCLDTAHWTRIAVSPVNDNLPISAVCLYPTPCFNFHILDTSE